MASNNPRIHSDLQVAEQSAPEVYCQPPEVYNPPAILNENNPRSRPYMIDRTEKEAIYGPYYKEFKFPGTRNKTITLSKKKVIIGGVVLVLVIGGLIGGLVGGLMSRTNSNGDSSSSPGERVDTETRSSFSSSQPSDSISPLIPDPLSTPNRISSSTSPITESSNPTSPSSSTRVIPTRGSYFYSIDPPAPYPTVLSNSNLIRNAQFEDDLLGWSNPQSCWTSLENAITSDETPFIARVYDNNKNPRTPCNLTQELNNSGRGGYALAFQYGTFWDSAQEARDPAKKGGRLIVKAGGKSDPSVLMNRTYSVPGRGNGFAVAAFEIFCWENDFVVEFSGWSGGSRWDIGKVQLLRGMVEGATLNESTRS